ncbi:uncharacterized protein DUF3530 [Alteromonadaceae bacterium 2753L.S.0a.02]|nr:uncharacterized protein DUF3530 [Alteromonadaceae bacterium 2753L.S.0a.02]
MTSLACSRYLTRIVLNMAKPLNRYLPSWLTRCLALYLGLQIGLSNAQAATEQPTTNPTKPASQPPAAEDTIPPISAPDIYQQQLTLLAAELKNKNLVWLTANNEKFPALWQPDTSGNPFGAVLIVHGAGQTVDWPSTVKHLRNTLGDYGWATLSIALPDPVAPAAPERPENDDQELHTVNEDSSDKPKDTEQNNNNAAEKAPTNSVETKVTARIKAAMDYLNSKGQYNIVFAGEGLGAARVTHYLQSISREFPAKLNKQKVSSKTSKAIIRRPVRALILMNARNEIPFDPEIGDSKIYDWFNDTGLPILDIYFGNHYLDDIEPEERKKAARRLRLEHYIQVSLLESPTQMSNGETPLSRRVRGFLSKYAKGVELGGKR